MGSGPDWLIDLTSPAARVEHRVGGKAAHLARLKQAGFPVVGGFCIAADAYECFVQESQLKTIIAMELQRKPFEAMRWEELWDAALRIRSAFLCAPVPAALVAGVEWALQQRAAPHGWAVRSSAPGEDSPAASFAGLHESVLPVHGSAAVVDAIRTVWASLWSDAALLYRRELDLDPRRSRMAVLLQPFVRGAPSGVAFGRDPMRHDADRVVIEAVPALCGDLVDGAIEPDHWLLDRGTGEIVDQRLVRGTDGRSAPALLPDQLDAILAALLAVEQATGWPVDMEWTWHEGELILLQARPLTVRNETPDDRRPWYLSLKPSKERFQRLAERVVGTLIPELTATCERLAGEPLDALSDGALASAIDRRLTEVERWTRIYTEDFIPFAHGVRQFGVYYNDLLRPADPFEFVLLLSGQDFLAGQRDESMRRLAAAVSGHAALRTALRELEGRGMAWNDATRQRLRALPGGVAFLADFEALCRDHLDFVYEGTRLADSHGMVLHALLELGTQPSLRVPAAADVELERRYLAAAGPKRQAEASDLLALARLSWRLRDDDNILVGRLESQLARAAEAGAERLRRSGRCSGAFVYSTTLAGEIAAALRSQHGVFIAARGSATGPADDAAARNGRRRARQLIGQPAAPGLAAGTARLVRHSDDLMAFSRGDVLICDAIQPTMTHLVPLASAVVERRGGMLIHGAIIARELGIPCVSGVEPAMRDIRNGDRITVDGYLGIVTLGEAEFDLERTAGEPGCA
ncbi:PEP/pyruvate-binding domain-containing protein [Methylotetracoccus oryzae]|uniref:PEP/pyruvate-binding domain-containing protein n=1 Tax=Methylotetracoccus oryzae TaxID=1919059 RepID=UPI0019139A29|nr:PEP/pyruvate-binding domain-containing protein [Methylotetracoccus oryzae]